jgi:hypothetical protein
VWRLREFLKNAGATIETLISTMGIRYLRFDGSGGTFSEQKKR